MNIKQLCLILSLAFVVYGCSNTSETAMDDDMMSSSGGSGSGSGSGASSSGMGDDGLRSGSGFADPTAPGGDLEVRVIYFEFDKAEITDDSKALLKAHGAYLADNGGIDVRLEGHADERGSREYNIGLGERRAQAVKQVLMLNGVGTGQLETVSYGEERPAALGSDDEAWSLNRRVELVYNP